MTNQTTYILSDAECVLGLYTPPVLPDQPQWHDGYEVENGYEMFQQEMDYWRERCHELKEEAKAKAVRFADQLYAETILADQHSILSDEIKPDTIYTVEGYEVIEFNPCTSYPEPCENGLCDHLKYGTKLATLKRIEPVVVEQENDGWIPVSYSVPKIGVDVLVWVADDWNSFDVARFELPGQWNTNHDLSKYRAITHWKYITPPKQ